MKELGRRRTQLLDDLRNGGRYWGLRKEIGDQKRWKRQSISRTEGRNASYLP